MKVYVTEQYQRGYKLLTNTLTKNVTKTLQKPYRLNTPLYKAIPAYTAFDTAPFTTPV